MKYQNILETIGQTPVVKLNRLGVDSGAEVMGEA